MIINFQSDKVSVRGPKVDNSYSVTFEVGEYQLNKIKEFVTIVDKVMTVNVEVEDEH